jgi:hypothetical protein
MPTVKKLAKVLYTTGDAEINIEQLRQAVCKILTFEPYASFQRIDRGSKGYISSRDMLKFMR